MQAAGIRSWARTFDALQNRDYRWYWLYRLGGECVVNLNGVAQGWLVYQLTGSALALGWVGAGRAVASLLIAPWGGVLCDRMDRRTVLLWSRVITAASTLAVGVLVSVGAIRVWHVALATMVDGVMLALLTAAQQAIVSDLVGEKMVMNALSLNAVGLGITGLVFPAVSGVLITWIGVAGVYYISTGIYLLALLALRHLPASPVDRAGFEPPLRAMAEGLRYVVGSRLLAAMVAVALARFLFAMSYRTFMPKFADEVLRFDAAGLGLLLSAPGLGALVASVSVASLRDYRYKGLLLMITGLASGMVLVLLSVVRCVPLVFLLFAALGGLTNVLRILNQTIMQTYSTDRFRGRVMSLYGVAMGTGPLANVPMGALADAHGVPFVLAIQGGVLLAVFGALTAQREVRKAA